MTQTRVGGAIKVGSAAGKPLKASKVLDGTQRVYYAPDATMHTDVVTTIGSSDPPVAVYAAPTRWPAGGMPAVNPRVLRFIIQGTLAEPAPTIAAMFAQALTMSNDLITALESYEFTYVMRCSVTSGANQFFFSPLGLLAPTDGTTDYFSTRTLNVVLWHSGPYYGDNNDGTSSLLPARSAQHAAAVSSLAAHYDNFPKLGAFWYAWNTDQTPGSAGGGFTADDVFSDFYSRAATGAGDLGGQALSPYGYVFKGRLDVSDTAATILPDIKTFFGLV